MHVTVWVRMLKIDEPFPYSFPVLVTEAKDPVEDSEALGMADHKMGRVWGPK